MKITIYIIPFKTKKKYTILLLYVDDLPLTRDDYKNILTKLKNIYKINMK